MFSRQLFKSAEALRVGKVFFTGFLVVGTEVLEPDKREICSTLSSFKKIKSDPRFLDDS